MGGENDTTNVIKKSQISIITNIDLDHIKFLGNTVEDITKTKLRSIKNKLVSAKQVHAITEEIVGNYKKKYNKIEASLTDEDIFCIKQFGLTNKIPKFIRRNIELGVLAFKNLGFKFNKNILEGLSFEGRFQKVKNNIILDVGHNPMAARKIFENISNNTILIYNSYTDKDYLEVIEILSPKLKKIILIDVPDKRVCKTKFLLEKFKSSPVSVSTMHKNFCILNNENYLVFGSFSVVKEFTIRFL
jgi:dihydrofolate synthase/folylpolyglutamate synthase